MTAVLSSAVLAAVSERLFELLVVLVLLLAPIWRGIVEARRKAVEKRRRDTGRSTTEVGGGREERFDPWEALLRGELPEPEPEREEASAQPERQPAPPIRRPPPRAPTVPVAPPVADVEESTEDALETGIFGEDALERGAYGEGALEAGVSTEGALEAAETRTPLAASMAPVFGILGGGSTRAGRRRRGRARGRLLAVSPRDAVVWREVLGPPVSLRSWPDDEGR